jgi:DNA-binding transcriptional LysR family regulator
MNLIALRNFLAVIDAGSVRRAADNLNLAQSALSRQILALEREFGARLLVRLPRGVEPTPAGEVVAREARAVDQRIALAREEIASVSGLVAGRVRLAVIEPVAETLIPACIARLRRSHPGISFDVRVGNTRQVVALLREGVVELAVAYNPPREAEFVVRAAVPQPLMGLVRRGHELAEAGQLPVAALAGHPVILPPAGSPTRLLIDEAVRREGAAFTRIALESDSVALRRGVAATSDAVAILAQISARTTGGQHSLRAFGLDSPILQNGSLEVLALRTRPLSKAVSRFEPILRTALKTPEAALEEA